MCIRDSDYLHPKIKKILEPTYGVIIYQEQVMQIAQALSGFSAGEADILRKAMGKKKSAMLEKQKEKFINGAVKNGITKETAMFIFGKIEPFAQYGFNKSHAAAYAMIAYQTAYLKTYYPNEFIAASMSNELSNTDKLSEFFEELKRLKTKIQRPCINECFAEFVPKENNLFYALGAIKNVGFEAISQVVEERMKNGKFKSISDFINRVNPKNINKLQLEGLVKAGAFDSLRKRGSMVNALDSIIAQSQMESHMRETGQTNLFQHDTNQQGSPSVVSDIGNLDAEPKDKVAWENELLGIALSSNPLKDLVRDAPDNIVTSRGNLATDKKGQRVTVLGQLSYSYERFTQTTELS